MGFDSQVSFGHLHLLPMKKVQDALSPVEWVALAQILMTMGIDSVADALMVVLSSEYRQKRSSERSRLREYLNQYALGIMESPALLTPVTGTPLLPAASVTAAETTLSYMKKKTGTTSYTPTIP